VGIVLLLRQSPEPEVIAVPAMPTKLEELPEKTTVAAPAATPEPASAPSPAATPTPTRTSTPQAKPRTTTTQKSPATKNCNPPFFVDSEGFKVFKPGCLQK
jgi:serine/threonine-protein kinase